MPCESFRQGRRAESKLGSVNSRRFTAVVIIILFFFLLLRSARVVPAGDVGVVDLFNSKVVIIGVGKEGLPIILGGDTTPPAQPHPQGR